MTKYINFGAILAASIVFASPSCSAEPLVESNSTVISEVKIGDEIKFCDDCPIFVRVPSAPPKLRPVIYVAKFELTWKNYLAAYRDGSCQLPNSEPAAVNTYLRLTDKLQIDWPIHILGSNEVDCYLGWLHRKSGKKIVIPTEAEWEWFAAAGSPALYPWGDLPDLKMAAVKGSTISADRQNPQTAKLVWPHISGVKVGSFPPNNWGLYDVIGNLPELTSTVISGEDRLRSNPKSEFARQTRDKNSVVIKSSHWWIDEIPKDGIRHKSHSVVWNDRYLTKVAIRAIIIK